MRPLSIPTMIDRCRARLVALALEPEVEARLHRDVYGFRPGRSQHDAMASLRNFADKVPQGKWVLDADIKDFFGSVSRSFLMGSLKLPRPIVRFIRSLLHAPTMDDGRMVHTPGIPQGSPLSPVLANLVLSGLHEHMEQHFRKLRESEPQTLHWKSPAIIVYADDLVALHVCPEALQHARDAIQDFLRPRGLRLHPDKTCIRHTLDELTGTPGFDFLGFTVRSFRVGKFKKGAGKSGMQTLIRPSRKSLLKHHEKLATILRQNHSSPIGGMIGTLNRCIRGWCNYFKTENSSGSFSREDHILFNMLWHFLKRRHQHMTPAHELYALYWPRTDGRKRFRDPASKTCLLSHADFPVEAHIKLRGDASFFNGDRAYWSTRRKRLHPLTRVRRELQAREYPEHPALPARDALQAASQEAVWLLGPKSCSSNDRGAGCGETRTSGSEGEGGPATGRSTLTQTYARTHVHHMAKQ